jgi:hypothetical protein
MEESAMGGRGTAEKTRAFQVSAHKTSTAPIGLFWRNS